MKYIALLLFFVIFAVSANQDMQKGYKQAQTSIPSSQSLTMTDVQAAFAQEGSMLNGWDNPQHFYTLNGISPAFYKANSGEFAIYVFKSDADRVQGREDFDVQTATAKVALSHIYEVRNVLIFELRRAEQDTSMQKIVDILNGTARQEILSIDQVKAVIQEQGIDLEHSDFMYKWFKLGLQTEYSFNLNTKEQLYVYVFDSAAKVDMGLKQIQNQNALYNIAHTPMSYRVNNILIMYMRYNPIPGIEGKIQAAVDTLHLIQ